MNNNIVHIKTKANPIILIPITENEKENEKDIESIYLLFKIGNDIKIAIPAIANHFPYLGNTDGSDETFEKSYFKLDNSLINRPNEVDRPIFKIIPTQDRFVDDYSVINGVNVSLDDVLKGIYKPDQDTPKLR